LLRMLVGTMWWQQTLRKIPPNFDGLRYWMEQEAAHASVALLSAFVGSRCKQQCEQQHLTENELGQRRGRITALRKCSPFLPPIISPIFASHCPCADADKSPCRNDMAGARKMSGVACIIRSPATTRSPWCV
jgi:hypothetical protein